ncbi:hypothetical protein BSKO_08228 [Bryopsis sp. KO-2023]|nr:hypothetical protein BSKO_08228 [Bryopsis sp. KO-2023]
MSAGGGEGLNTYTTSPRRKAGSDGSLYTAGQGLVAVVNNPGTGSLSSISSLNLLCWPGVGSEGRWNEVPPPIAPGVLRDVTRVDFANYLTRTSSLHDRFYQARHQLKEDSARRLNVGDPGGPSALRGEGLVQALRQVPTLYFQEDFSMTRPETFHEVVKGETEEEKSVALETQNGYLDIVETELLNEIAARSDSFFEAAESLQSLRMSMAETLEEIRGLRHGMDIVNSGLCERARKVQTLNRRRENLKEAVEMLQVVEAVVHSQEALHLLVLGRDYSSALALLDNLHLQCTDQDLSRLHCLRHLPSSLANATTSITESMVGDFVELMRWKQSSTEVHSAAMNALERSGLTERLPTPSASEPDSGEDLQASLLSLLQGLGKTGTLSGVLSQIRASGIDQLKSALRSVMEILLPPMVCASVSDGEAASHLQTQSLGDQLKALTAEHFLKLMGACLAVGEACCEHFVRMSDMIAKIATEGKVTGHKGAIDRMAVDILQVLVETMHNRWAKTMMTRLGVQQSMADLLELVDLSQECIDLATFYNVRPVAKLSSVLQAQCKAHLEAAHTQNVASLQEALEQEPWTLADVGQECQSVVDRLTSNETASCSGESNGGEQNPPIRRLVSMRNGSDPLSAITTLHANGQDFRIVATAQKTILMMNEYLLFHNALPDFATETGRRIVELSTLFNARSCQLVLGAQAMRQSGLKSITAKHLALCSQCLALFLVLHEPIKSLLLKEQGQSRRAILEPELERLKQDLQTHLDGIHAKLVAIMKERLLLSTRQLSETAPRWGEDIQDPTGVIEPSQTVQQMAKQLQILSRVLTPILLSSQMQEIFSGVAQTFSEVLGPVFEGLSVGEDWDEERMERWEVQWKADCAFLVETLNGLPMNDRGSQDCLEVLKGVLKAGPPNNNHGGSGVKKIGEES